jgi:hypothetical protein
MYLADHSLSTVLFDAAESCIYKTISKTVASQWSHKEPPNISPLLLPVRIDLTRHNEASMKQGGVQIAQTYTRPDRTNGH